jgi:hypothetical protein
VSETFEYDESTDPPAWRIEGPGEFRGRIAMEDSDLPAADEQGSSFGSYSRVSGWIEDGGVRLDVFGLVRTPR